MDKQHAKELIELKKQGLVKMRLDGPTDKEIIAHDFIVKKQLINRDPEKPTLYDLYRGYKDTKNVSVETFLDEETYTERLKAEDAEMGKHGEKVFKEVEE